MDNHIEIGKLEAARRHLETAILMFFERKDPVVIYSVSWSAYQILSDICKEKKIHRQMEDNPIIKEFGVSKEFMSAFRAPRNFFHHADKDPEETIKFFPDMAFLMPLLATELYGKLISNPFFSGKVIQMWFYFKYPQTVPESLKLEMKKIPYNTSYEDYDLFLELLLNNNA